MCCLFWKHFAMLHCHSKMCGLLFAGWCIISHAEDVVTKLDTKIMTAETEFNSSLNTYNTFANATETLANNVSKFQALIQERYDKNLPFSVVFFVLCLTFGTSWWGASVSTEEGCFDIVELKSGEVWGDVLFCFMLSVLVKPVPNLVFFFGRCEGLLSVSIGLKLILVWSEMNQYVYIDTCDWNIISFALQIFH